MNSKGTSEFIDIYRDSVCLWNSGRALYANRNARTAALKNLQSVMLKFDNTINLASVRKKVDSLRTMFFREHKKVLASESGSGTGGDEVYVPQWAHYNELIFLATVQRAARAGTDSLDTPSLNHVNDIEEEHNSEEVSTLHLYHL